MRRYLLALAFMCLTGLAAGCSDGERPYLTDPANPTTSTVTGEESRTTGTMPERLDPNDPDYPTTPPPTTVTYPSS